MWLMRASTPGIWVGYTIFPDQETFDDSQSEEHCCRVNEGGIKPYALSKIYISDDKIIHESIGTFFSEDGARKRFTLAQGLEWTGGDSIDDYCQLDYIAQRLYRITVQTLLFDGVFSLL